MKLNHFLALECHAFTFQIMRIDIREGASGLKKATLSIRAGRLVILTDSGVPVALIESLRPASHEEQKSIQKMIDAGFLRPTRKSGTVREWKRKRARSKTA
jgi:antitoxin (DNA-binding transcriptional repressor) of toxin-antitoxin stability system